jgi:DNA polymerase I
MIYLVTTNPEQTACTSGFEYMPWDAALAALRDSVYLFIDIETTGFNFMEDRILSIQMASDSNDQWVFIFDKDKMPSIFEVINSCKMVVGHNIKFDLKFLMYQGLEVNCNIYDTMLCEQILVNGTNLRAGLDSVVQRYCQIRLDKSIRTTFSSTSKLTDRQLEYAANDVKYLKAVMLAQISALKKNDLMHIAQLECKACLAFLQIEYNGLTLDTAKWMSMVNALQLQSMQCEADLNTIIDTDPLFESIRIPASQLDMFLPESEVMGTRLNWNSPMQTLRVFQCVDNSVIGTSERDTLKIATMHTIGKQLRTYREMSKKVSSFGEAFIAHVFADGKIHPRFVQIKRTGRVSCKEPNMQQIPANNDYRNCFISEDDHVFVSADYSSQELCIIAHGSKDPVFNHALRNGHDLHSVCAALVFGDRWKEAGEDSCVFEQSFEKCNCPEHKKLRTAVKSINFGLAYGMGPKKLSETMEISMSEASTLIENYFKAFPKIKDFLEGMSRSGVKQGFIKTFKPWGRTRWFDDWIPRGMDMATKGRIERVSKNTPIQGTAADMTKHALVLCYDYIKTNNIPVKLVMTVHDQIDTTCPRDYAEVWAAQLKNLMEKAAEHIMGNDLLKAEVDITDTWSK